MRTAPPPGELRALAFFGGGTGGHLFPGVAVAERARERFPGCRALFFHTGREIEASVLGGRGGLETRALALPQPGRTVTGWARYIGGVLRSVGEIRADLRQGVDVAFGLGSYASLPGILAARAESIPVLLLEQNCSPGRVNKLLAPLADAISCPFPEACPRLGGRREVTGNPVRREVLAAAEARAARGTGDGARPGSGKKTVLVVGGSQGAHAINMALLQALGALEELREQVRWVHVTGTADEEAMVEAYRKGGWEARVMRYTDELPALMAECDLVLGRAGGTTVAELAVLGVPSILIPYPHHRDRHQQANAEVLERAGGGRLLAEAELNPGSLRRLLGETLFSPAALAAMRRNSLRLGRPEAADAVKSSRCP
jgi:UDP-N-acetylglucosamine--N-acetylmuramyl-(pentapeptide) pyrophosphoryl-undecaprenol N-acetylglucosamine transferase